MESIKLHDEFGWQAWHEAEYLKEIFYQRQEKLKADKVVRESSLNSYALTEDKQIIMVGIKDVIAVSLKEKLIVMHKSRIGELKHIMENIENKKLAEADTLLVAA